VRLAEDLLARRLLHARQQRKRCVVVERLEHQLLEAGNAARLAQKPQRRARAAPPRRHDEQVRLGRRAAEQFEQEIGRGLVGPVCVVDQERGRPEGGSQLARDRRERHVPLVHCRARLPHLEPARPRQAGDRGQQRGLADPGLADHAQDAG
jgi:hypothetical protein